MLKTSRLMKSEDLNHHGTLFAGRMAKRVSPFTVKITYDTDELKQLNLEAKLLK